MELPHEKFGRYICPCHRNPKHAAQQEQHEGYPRFCGKQDFIHALGAAIAFLFFLHHCIADFLCAREEGKGALFLKFRGTIAAFRFRGKGIPINAYGPDGFSPFCHGKEHFLEL